MKKLLIGIQFMAVLFASCATFEAIPESKLSYQEIVEVDGISKDILFDKSAKWLAESFRSYKSVVEYTNKEDGSIIGDGSIYVPVPIGGNVLFALKIETKDNRARLTFSNMRFAQNPTYSFSQMHLDAFIAEAKSLTDSFRKFMKKKNDNW